MREGERERREREREEAKGSAEVKRSEEGTVDVQGIMWLSRPSVLSISAGERGTTCTCQASISARKRERRARLSSSRRKATNSDTARKSVDEDVNPESAENAQSAESSRARKSVFSDLLPHLYEEGGEREGGSSKPLREDIKTVEPVERRKSVFSGLFPDLYEDGDGLEEDESEGAGDDVKTMEPQRKSVFSGLFPDLYEEEGEEEASEQGVEVRNRRSEQSAAGEGGEPSPSYEEKLVEALDKLGLQTQLEIVGEGSVARIYKAWRKDGKGYPFRAVKVLHENFRKSKNAQNLFKQEAKLWMQLDHPNIIKAYDYDSELHFMVQEYCEGDNLYAMLAKQRSSQSCFPILDVPQIAVDLAEALAYIHEMGMVHRDIKSLNVIIGADSGTQRRTAKICDFGSAMLLSSIPSKYYLKQAVSNSKQSLFERLANDLLESVIGAGDESKSAFEAVGTPYWMAPEMLDPKILNTLEPKFEKVDSEEEEEALDSDGQDQAARPYLELRDITKKLDVYSFAVVLYELFHRAHPWFEGRDGVVTTRADVKKTIVDKQRRLPLAPYLNKEIKDLISNSWHVDAYQRPQMDDVVERLKGAISDVDLSGSIDVASMIAKVPFFFDCFGVPDHFTDYLLFSPSSILLLLIQAHLLLPSGRRVYLGDKEKTVIGRGGDCCIQLDSATASRQHAFVQLKATNQVTPVTSDNGKYVRLDTPEEDYSFEIVDSSTNGTKLNMRPLVNGNPRKLSNGDRIKVDDKVVATFYNNVH